LYDSRAEKCATPFPVENRESELEADRISIGNPRRNDEQKITAFLGDRYSTSLIFYHDWPY